MNTRRVFNHFALVIMTLVMLSVPTPVWSIEKQSIDSSLVDSIDEAVSQENTEYTKAQYQSLMDKAISKGRVPVIVKLRHADPPTSPSDRIGLAMHRQSLSSIQDRMVNEIEAARGIVARIQGLKRFRYTPAIAFQADSDELETLINSPDVEGIFEDKAVPPTLSDSVPLIGADSSWSFNGYTGQGQVVAIIDTGVDKSHPFLSGKVVSEACYSSNTAYSTSLCPFGYTSSTALGSGVACATSTEGCGHGTHVAGIAAGIGAGFTGVASGADIIAIQVFSRFSGSDCTDYGVSSPCISAFDSDIIRSLERVYDLRNSFNIASVNMSLGEGKYTSACDDDPIKPIIDSLKAVGTATVISSGNDGYVDALSRPACISSAVSVGSSTKTDTVSDFSNSAYFLDVLAPGSDIYSSTQGGGFEAWNGTSMAAPHVAGAWAVLKQANPNASVNDILNVLTSTGKSIADNRIGAGGRIIPRTQVDEATETDGLPNLTPFKPDGWSDKIVASSVQGTNTDAGVIFETNRIFIDWAILNDSTSDVGEFTIALYVDNILKDNWYTDLKSYQYAYVTDYDIGYLPAGPHSLKIVADSYGAVSESNERDNEYTKNIVVTQACIYSISPSSGSFTSSGGTSSVSVTASNSTCAWTTSESLSWVSLSPTSGNGSRSVTISVSSNTGTARSGSVTIAGQSYIISQSGVPIKTTNVLSNLSPNLTINAGTDARVFGTTASNQIILEGGAQAELINFPGSNTIIIQSNSNLFTVSRSGTVVTFEGSDGTILKMPASATVQTINFKDLSYGLVIKAGAVYLGEQMVTLSTALLNGAHSVCDSNNLNLCTSNTACSLVDGYWWSDNTCNSIPQPDGLD